jgi:hypothetical protein
MLLHLHKVEEQAKLILCKEQKRLSQRKWKLTGELERVPRELLGALEIF